MWQRQKGERERKEKGGITKEGEAAARMSIPRRSLRLLRRVLERKADRGRMTTESCGNGHK